MITLHTPTFGIFVTLFLVVAYVMTIRVFTKWGDWLDAIGYTVMFIMAIAAVIAGGVLPFLL